MRQGFSIPGGFNEASKCKNSVIIMAYWRLYYHLIWTTKNRHPFITPEKEAQLYPYIVNKANSLDCIIHAIGGIEDHIHLIVSIPPKLAIAEFFKKIKGSSSRFYNNITDHYLQFAWQEGYRIFSFGSKQLNRVTHYVRNQKEHHAQQTAIASLEKIENRDDSPSLQLRSMEQELSKKLSFACTMALS